MDEEGYCDISVVPFGEINDDEETKIDDPDGNNTLSVPI
jgi:hypothetical protein